MALFITFEGGEGSGKSTQARRLHNRLQKLAVPALLTHEPGVTPLGRKITRLLKWHKDVAISPVAELLLFNASRAQLVADVIRPALEDGKTVICDRYADSTTAYQGYGRGLDMEMVLAANATGTQGLRPDITVLLDVPFETAMQRKAADKLDRFEEEAKEFHEKVRHGYLELAENDARHWLTIDATLEPDRITEIIWKTVSRMLSVG